MKAPKIPKIPDLPKTGSSPKYNFYDMADPKNLPLYTPFSPLVQSKLALASIGGIFAILLFLIAFSGAPKTFASKFSLFIVSIIIGGISIYAFYSGRRTFKEEKARQKELEDREYELRKAQLSGSFINEDTVSSDEVISPYFTDYQKNLKKQRQNLVNKYDGVTRLIDSLFGRGTLTSERYSASIKKAYKTGISAAKKGADLCDALKGEDLPNDSSRNVLDHYMDLTKQMADLIENQIVVLAGLDLDRSEKIQTSLNEQISEINSTIHMYE